MLVNEPSYYATCEDGKKKTSVLISSILTSPFLISGAFFQKVALSWTQLSLTASHSSRRNPARSSLARYYGMGFDTYGVVQSLYTNDGAAWSMRGLSGDLSLDAQGRVRRVLPLAQFQSGRPVALDAPRTQPIEATRLIGQR